MSDGTPLNRIVVAGPNPNPNLTLTLTQVLSDFIAANSTRLLQVSFPVLSQIEPQAPVLVSALRPYPRNPKTLISHQVLAKSSI